MSVYKHTTLLAGVGKKLFNFSFIWFDKDISIILIHFDVKLNKFTLERLRLFFGGFFFILAFRQNLPASFISLSHSLPVARVLPWS